MLIGIGVGIAFKQVTPEAADTVPVAGATASYYASDLAALSDGDGIATWADASGNGYDLAQGTAGSRLQWGATEQAAISTGAKLMTNASVPYDRRALSVLWIGTLYQLDGDVRIVSFNGLGLILRTLEGVLSVWRGSNTSTTLRPPCYKRIAILMTCSASGVSIYIDDVANVQSISANGAATGTQFEIGNTQTASASAKQNVDEIHIWPSALNATDAEAVLDYAAAKYGTGRAATAPTGRIIIDGDSTAHGVSAALNRCWGPALGVDSNWFVHCFGTTSARLDQIDDDAGTEINTPYANSTNWLFVMAGTNDLAAGDSGATVDSELAAYCNAAITAGFSKSNIVVFTVWPSNTYSGRRDDANTAIRANYSGYAGHLVDVAADANLGVTGGSFNNASYYVDGVHMNAAGQTLLAALIRSTISGEPW